MTEDPSQQSSSKRPPPLRRQAWDLTRSLATFVVRGMKMVTKEQYRQRLEICDTCDRRRGNRCLECGCRLATKAKGKVFKCPLDKWPKLTAEDQS